MTYSGNHNIHTALAPESYNSRIFLHHIRAGLEGLKRARHLAFHDLHVGHVAAGARPSISAVGRVRESGVP